MASFKQLQPSDFVISSDSVAGTLWSTGNPTLTTFLLHQLKQHHQLEIIFYQFTKQLHLKIVPQSNLILHMLMPTVVVVYYLILLLMDNHLQDHFMVNIEV